MTAPSDAAHLLLLTFGAGTGHIFYPLLPIMLEVACENSIRPERPIAVAAIHQGTGGQRL